ncbi:hypothetical protein [Spongiactinospora sp. TRM90649]|uniref:hypothetical protein n=1 Tax=Spongiactinospora sp. TRM90649 TaxID=3031114 RepID=UPI0023F9F57B|nr:hypothetical protein [Spongiactinospora sp. TRM90649]MDF5758252.1 hypothetical protein [Spongiactinospora sp. TRM90649]
MRPRTAAARAAAVLVPALALLVSAPQAQAMTAERAWGPYRAPAGKAVVSGDLRVSRLDTGTIPPVATVRIRGVLRDRVAGPACGYAVFRITYLKSDGSLPFVHRTIRACGGPPKRFAFTGNRVHLVGLKVCGEARRATPSLTCLYSGTWKSLHITR